MNLTPRLRRGLAATAIVGTAVLVPAVALASSGPSAGPAAAPAAAAAAAATHRCYTADLTSWLGQPGDGAAGSTTYQLEFSNVSGHSCTLYGYPGLSAWKASTQRGSAAARDHSHPSRLITLRPGGTAHVIWQVTDVENYPIARCKPAVAISLKVYPPGDYSSVSIPFNGGFFGCSRSGERYMHVSAVVAGTGIPGYSN
jgi:hypothetical protein